MKGLLFTYALTYGGAGVSLFRPFYGLLIYICFSIIRPESMWYWSVPEGNYSRIVAIGLLIGWAINGFGNWQIGRSRSIVFCFVGFWVWGLMSTLVSAQFPDRGYVFLESIGKILLPFLVGVSVITSMEQLKQLAWTIAGSVSYVAFEMNLSYYDGFNRLYYSGFGGMDNNCVAIEFVTAVGFMFFLGFAAKPWWQKGIAVVSTGLLINAIMFSFSRGGLLALIVTAAFAFLLIPKKITHYVAALATVALGIRLAGAEVLQRFFTTFADAETRDSSAQGRLDLWKNCWTLMLREPLFGVGPDHFTHYAKYEFGWGSTKEAHSLWFQTGAELGFVGVGLLLAFYLVCIWRLWPLTRKSSPVLDARVRDMTRMVIVGLVGFMFSSQFVSLEALELPYYMVLLGVGILRVAHQPAAISNESHEVDAVSFVPSVAQVQFTERP